ncbi:MAG: M23 family metallopeptidase [Oscillospiraceae bacterium]|nr:M23 family metallopeptidase [Oscillospiraceae bacterium]
MSTEHIENKREENGFTWFAAQVGLYVGAFFSAIITFFSFVFKNIWKIIKKIWHYIYEKVDRFVITSVRSFNEEWTFFKKEVKEAKGKIKENIKSSPTAIFSILGYYSKVAYKRHPHMFSSIINVVLPIASFAVLVTTINHWSSSTYALAVQSGGQDIGYVTSENVYIEAQNLVKERFDSDVSNSNMDLSAKYKVVTINPNEISDSETISDNIIEKSKGDSTYACGVYIDGTFVCALKNETDAMQVFNNILDAYETEDENDVVGFVEDIQYVQGLYPDNEETIWDSEKLANVLAGKKSEAKYYTVQMGDTLSQIAYANDISTAQLMAQNPEVSETIKVGDKLLVSNEVNYVRLKVVKTEVVNESTPFETVKKNSSNLYKGTTRVTQKGVKGLDQVTNLVTYVDGVKVSSEEINRVTLRNPVDEVIAVGTKKVSYGGSYTSSTYIKGQGSLIWPAVGCYTVSSPYGWRTLYGRSNFHSGIDLTGGGARGRSVVAAKSGTVTSAGWNGSYGYCVIINHGNGMSTLYAHMLSGSICVKPGQYVSGGSAIGKVGSTGNSTGPHLHFEVRINGTRVNPAPYIGA